MARKPAIRGGMNLAVLRIEGKQPDVERIARRLSLRLEQKWKEGEVGRNGRPHLSSGASATVADASSGAAMVAKIKRFLAKCQRLGVSFATVRAEISIGVSAGHEDQYVGTFGLSTSELNTLAKRGLSLSVAAYPTSDARH
jgi:hypothetical protein